MITTNVSGIADNWSNYFSQQVMNYEPTSIVAKPWSKPKELELLCKLNNHHRPMHKVSITVGPKTHCKHYHHHLPCFNQHKPYGVATQFLMNPFDDDDRPDWHEFHSKNRKPMIFEEIVDHCNHHGLIAVRPIEPTDPSDEIDEEVTI